MRMATFNIRHGRSVHDGAVSLERLSSCIRRLDPDVLALQAVDRDQPGSVPIDLTAVAAAAMGAVAHRFVAALSGTPGATWMASTGSEQPGAAVHGIALLSRYPAISWQVLRLPRLPVEQPRAAVAAQLDTPYGVLTVANTYLSPVPGWNRIQLRQLMRDLRGLPGPLVLMGDLNMSPPESARGSGLRPLGSAPTFPLHCPHRQLDHILTCHADLVAKQTSSPVLPISDRRPLIIDVSPR